MNNKSYDVVLDNGAIIPARAHDTDAGYDLFSPRTGVVPAHGSAVFDTGVHIAIPNGYCGLICSKSGLNIREGILSTGLIDSAYTGSLRVKLYNLSDKPYFVRAGDKISQIVFLPVDAPVLNKVQELPETERGDNGFGSTGR